MALSRKALSPDSRAGILLVLLSSMMLTTLLLSGCSQDDQAQPESKSVAGGAGVSETSSQVSISDIRTSTTTSYDCSTNAGTADKRSWSGAGSLEREPISQRR